MIKNKSNLYAVGNKKSPILYYGYIVVFCAFISLVVSFGTNYSFGVFFDSLIDDLGWSRAVTSVGYSIGQFFGGVVGIVTGRLSDRFGPKITVLICAIVMVLGCLLMSQVTQSWQLYVFYGIFVGFGYGGSSIALISTVTRWFKKRRGLMNGVTVAGIGTGTVLMPLLANFLLSIYDWRQSFVIIGLIVLVVMVPSALFLKRDPSKIGQKADGNNAPDTEDQDRKEIGLSFKETLRAREFWLLCFIYVLFGFYVQSIMVHIVPHAKSIGIDATSAALTISFLGIGSILGRIVMGGISDRIGIKYTMVVGLGLILIALIWLTVANSLWQLFVFAIVYGFSYGALIAMQALAPAKMFGLLSIGTLFGVISFVYTTGGAIGPIITGYIFDITGSYHTAFVLCAGLAAIGVILALSLRRPKKDGVHL